MVAHCGRELVINVHVRMIDSKHVAVVHWATKSAIGDIDMYFVTISALVDNAFATVRRSYVYVCC